MAPRPDQGDVLETKFFIHNSESDKSDKEGKGVDIVDAIGSMDKNHLCLQNNYIYFMFSLG